MLEELCDAMGACETALGRNISNKAPLFKHKVMELCAPLVEIQENSQTEAEVKSVCSLSHAAVHSYLVKNPRILFTSANNGELREENLLITSKTLASICLKYLSQPCYGQLLEKKGDAFITKDKQDINDHHLLTYAAKYWSVHLEGVAPTDGWYDQVADFVKSRQFLTVLQVQSLMVEGKRNLTTLFNHLSRIIFSLDLAHWLTCLRHQVNLQCGSVESLEWASKGSFPVGFLNITLTVVSCLTNIPNLLVNGGMY